MTEKRLRLVVSKSNTSMYAQIIDDVKGVTLVGMSTKKAVIGKKVTKLQAASALGEAIAKEALKLKIKRVVFDRANFRYLGRVKALAEAARKGGLDF